MNNHNNPFWELITEFSFKLNLNFQCEFVLRLNSGHKCSGVCLFTKEEVGSLIRATVKRDLFSTATIQSTWRKSGRNRNKKWKLLSCKISQHNRKKFKDELNWSSRTFTLCVYDLRRWSLRHCFSSSPLLLLLLLSVSAPPALLPHSVCSSASSPSLLLLLYVTAPPPPLLSVSAPPALLSVTAPPPLRRLLLCSVCSSSFSPSLLLLLVSAPSLLLLVSSSVSPPLRHGSSSNTLSSRLVWFHAYCREMPLI